MIRSTGGIENMVRLWLSPLNNWCLTTLIMWHTLCISPNNKPKSNIIVLVKTSYVIFIYTPHYKSFSDPQCCRYIGVQQKIWFLFLSWLCWACVKSILKISKTKYPQQVILEKITCNTPSMLLERFRLLILKSKILMLHICGIHVNVNITFYYVHGMLFIVGVCASGISTKIYSCTSHLH